MDRAELVPVTALEHLQPSPGGKWTVAGKTKQGACFSYTARDGSTNLTYNIYPCIAEEEVTTQCASFLYRYEDKDRLASLPRLNKVERTTPKQIWTPISEPQNQERQEPISYAPVPFAEGRETLPQDLTNFDFNLFSMETGIDNAFVDAVMEGSVDNALVYNHSGVYQQETFEAFPISDGLQGTVTNEFKSVENDLFSTLWRDYGTGEAPFNFPSGQ
ncbi:hypothetical protein VHEMI07105 [[Torrubiella] hemipterigena]|uniref:Uncharacterized protein n=1 Tax=[Torrubiella] hemipterigena TaxID=1531966 RepID=A0A0A1T9B5_9HYPO|nr:hypothetical protein VHEMI07105 [[Torrubiella] hemipterigena]